MEYIESCFEMEECAVLTYRFVTALFTAPSRQFLGAASTKCFSHASYLFPERGQVPTTACLCDCLPRWDTCRATLWKLHPTGTRLLVWSPACLTTKMVSLSHGNWCNEMPNACSIAGNRVICRSAERCSVILTSSLHGGEACPHATFFLLQLGNVKWNEWPHECDSVSLHIFTSHYHFCVLGGEWTFPATAKQFVDLHNSLYYPRSRRPLLGRDRINIQQQHPIRVHFARSLHTFI